MIGIQLRYRISGFILRIRSSLQYVSFPSYGLRSIILPDNFISTDDRYARKRARYLSLILSQSYVRANILRHSQLQKLGTGKFRVRNIIDLDAVIENLLDLSNVDNAWELTFAIGHIRDLIRDTPGSKTLSRTLSDGHRIARTLALAGVDFSMRVYIVRLNALSRLLVAASVHLLPRPHQGRYSMELISELHDLNSSKKSQIVHAVRIFARSFELRRALRSTAPALQKDAP